MTRSLTRREVLKAAAQEAFREGPSKAGSAFDYKRVTLTCDAGRQQ